MYYSVPSYYTEDLTCYTTEILKYCATTYVSPANTTKAAECYTKKAVSLLTTTYGAPEYYNTRHPSFASLLSLLPHNTEALKVLLCPELLHDLRSRI
jgi:hypothetical protein